MHGEPNTSASVGHNEIVGRLPPLTDAFKKASAQSDLDMKPIFNPIWLERLQVYTSLQPFLPVVPDATAA